MRVMQQVMVDRRATHERIRQLAALGLTGAVIALRLGVSQRTVWRALKPLQVSQK